MAGPNIALVKEACLATVQALSRRDLVGVLAFDLKPRWILEFTEAERQDYIENKVLRLFADGGTHIQPALVEALRAFQGDPRARRSAVKHCVLLSDGDTPPADFETVVRQMAGEGITVSTVCVAAAKFDPGLMAQIAGWGQGRFKFSDSFKNVPKLIVNDVKQAVATLPNPAGGAGHAASNPPPAEGLPMPPMPRPSPLQPVVMGDPHEALTGIDPKTLPGLRGLLASVARPKADLLLMTRDKKPVLALWRRGLGKTAVWTSDLSGPWSADWLAWKDSGKLFAQFVHTLSGSGPDAELAGRIRISSGTVRLDGSDLVVSDAGGRPLKFVEEGDGTAVLTLPPGQPGELQRILLQRADGKKLVLGAVMPYGMEFDPPDPVRDLFAGALEPLSWQALERKLAEGGVSGERRSDLAPWLIVAVLLLLPIDVALRRYAA
jgi:hypothetical protein